MVVVVVEFGALVLDMDDCDLALISDLKKTGSGVAGPPLPPMLPVSRRVRLQSPRGAPHPARHAVLERHQGSDRSAIQTPTRAKHGNDSRNVCRRRH